jgi:hypothetical protein
MVLGAVFLGEDMVKSTAQFLSMGACLERLLSSALASLGMLGHLRVWTRRKVSRAGPREDYRLSLLLASSKRRTSGKFRAGCVQS